MTQPLICSSFAGTLNPGNVLTFSFDEKTWFKVAVQTRRGKHWKLVRRKFKREPRQFIVSWSNQNAFGVAP